MSKEKEKKSRENKKNIEYVISKEYNNSNLTISCEKVFKILNEGFRDIPSKILESYSASVASKHDKYVFNLNKYLSKEGDEEPLTNRYDMFKDMPSKVMSSSSTNPPSKYKEYKKLDPKKDKSIPKLSKSISSLEKFFSEGYKVGFEENGERDIVNSFLGKNNKEDDEYY